MAVLRAVEQGREPGFEASLFKTRGSEIYQEITRLATDAAWVYGLINHADRGGTRLPHPGPDGTITAMQDWLNERKKTIRSEERRVGKESVSTCRFRCLPSLSTQLHMYQHLQY